MSRLRNKDLVRRFYDDVFNANRPARLEGFVASDFVDHNPAPGQSPDREGLRRLFLAYRAAFPDATFHVEDLIAEGDRVAARLTFLGTHLGEFLGLAPTGAPVCMAAVDLLRVAHGRIAERWGSRDDLRLREQIGALPALAIDPPH